MEKFVVLISRAERGVISVEAENPSIAISQAAFEMMDDIDYANFEIVGVVPEAAFKGGMRDGWK